MVLGIALPVYKAEEFPTETIIAQIMGGPFGGVFLMVDDTKSIHGYQLIYQQKKISTMPKSLTYIVGDCENRARALSSEKSRKVSALEAESSRRRHDLRLCGNFGHRSQKMVFGDLSPRV